MSELELAGQVVDLARRAAGSAADVEAAVDDIEQGLTRFANSYIHQNVANAGMTVRLRVHLDGRTVSGTTTVTDTDGIQALVERSVAAVRVGPLDPGWPGLSPAMPMPRAGVADPATAQAQPQDRAARVRDFVAAAAGLEAAGYCRTVVWRGAYANSAGQAVAASTAEAAMDGVVRNKGADGVARLAVTELDRLDGAVLGERAAAKARAGVEPIELPPGQYEIVLEPAATVDLLQNLSYVGFNGRAYLNRQSFLVPGDAQFDQAITIVDFPADVPGLPFDSDGTPKRRLDLVTAGVTGEITHDRRTAAEAGTASTGSAIMPGAPPFPHHMSMAAGVGPVAEATGPVDSGATSALVAAVGRGLLVTDFWYTRILDPKRLVVTGLTRNGVWLIEDGEVVGPVRNMRFTQSYAQALAPGGVLGVGATARMIQDSWQLAWWTAPALHLAEWNFTGGASG